MHLQSADKQKAAACFSKAMQLTPSGTEKKLLTEKLANL